MALLPREDVWTAALRVVSPPRRRSLPVKLGPWPIRRSRSEADGYQPPPPTTHCCEESSEKVSLKNVLARLDEECATIDKILIRDTDGKTLVDVESRHVEVEPRHDEDKKAVAYSAPRPLVNQEACKLLGSMLAISVAFTLTATPIMTILFARSEWGPIVIDENAPSRLAFAIALSIPAISVGFAFAMAAMALASLRNGYSFVQHYGRAWINAGLAVFAGIVLAIWVLAWVLPLTRHAA